MVPNAQLSCGQAAQLAALPKPAAPRVAVEEDWGGTALGLWDDCHGGPAFLPPVPISTFRCFGLALRLQSEGSLGQLGRVSQQPPALGISMWGRIPGRKGTTWSPAQQIWPLIGLLRPCRISSPITTVTRTLGDPLASEDGDFLQGQS